MGGVAQRSVLRAGAAQRPVLRAEAAQRPVLRAAHGRLARTEPTSFIYLFLLQNSKTVQDYTIMQAHFYQIL
jgi:hypothetical protein